MLTVVTELPQSLQKSQRDGESGKQRGRFLPLEHRRSPGRLGRDDLTLRMMLLLELPATLGSLGRSSKIYLFVNHKINNCSNQIRPI